LTGEEFRIQNVAFNIVGVVRRKVDRCRDMEAAAPGSGISGWD